MALDEHMHVGLLLPDLSKAFDCLPWHNGLDELKLNFEYGSKIAI